MKAIFYALFLLLAAHGAVNAQTGTKVQDIDFTKWEPNLLEGNVTLTQVTLPDTVRGQLHKIVNGVEDMLPTDYFMVALSGEEPIDFTFANGIEPATEYVLKVSTDNWKTYVVQAITTKQMTGITDQTSDQPNAFAAGNDLVLSGIDGKGWTVTVTNLIGQTVFTQSGEGNIIIGATDMKLSGGLHIAKFTNPQGKVIGTVKLSANN